jgi:raffinose/stachyose/melibiose transport system permease protein
MESTFRKTNIMYLPALALFFVFVVYPFFEGIRIAFTNWNGFSQHFKYIGFANFAVLARDHNVRTAFRNTLLYGFGSTLLQQVLGLSYALLLNLRFKGRTVGRTITYLPVLISAVIMGYMWYFILQYDGALNDVIALFGGRKVLWLSHAGTAVGVIITINTLQYAGVSMIIYLAGLQNIPVMYYEAAHLDGAGAWSRFRGITLPLLYPAVLTSVTINLIGGLKLFDVIRALTGGGPGYVTHSLATLLNATYFGSQRAGYAAAIGVLLFVTILAFTIATQAASRKREIHY